MSEMPVHSNHLLLPVVEKTKRMRCQASSSPGLKTLQAAGERNQHFPVPTMCQVPFQAFHI